MFDATVSQFSSQINWSVVIVYAVDVGVDSDGSITRRFFSHNKYNSARHMTPIIGKSKSVQNGVGIFLNTERGLISE